MNYTKRYAQTKRPITVNFRELVPQLRYNAERYTHQIHPYPAKLLQHIPFFFLRSGLLSSEKPRVLDPFCGSGTVPLETALAGAIPIGADSNPLARLISSAKLAPVESKSILKWLEQLRTNWPHLEGGAPDVINLEHWFYPHVIRKLAKIKRALTEINPSPEADLLAVCFSATVGQVSLADPRVSVPVRLNLSRYREDHWLHAKSKTRLQNLKSVDVLSLFEGIVKTNLSRSDSLRRDFQQKRLKIYNDARSLKSDAGRAMDRNSVDLVMTSPPYLGAQKYIRSSSLSLGWLGLCPSTGLRKIESENIGREHHLKSEYREFLPTNNATIDHRLKQIYKKNPIRGHIASTYFREMREALAEMTRVLKEDGSLILVSSNNTVCGEPFHTKKYLRTIIETEFGLSCKVELIDHIKSRGLMTRRNKTAATIASESIFVFQKSE